MLLTDSEYLSIRPEYIQFNLSITRGLEISAKNKVSKY